MSFYHIDDYLYVGSKSNQSVSKNYFAVAKLYKSDKNDTIKEK